MINYKLGYKHNPYIRKDTTDATGYWELNLLPNDSLTPAITTYKVVQYDSVGVIGEYSLKVPGDSTGKAWQFPASLR